MHGVMLVKRRILIVFGTFRQSVWLAMLEGDKRRPLLVQSTQASHACAYASCHCRDVGQGSWYIHSFPATTHQYLGDA